MIDRTIAPPVHDVPFLPIPQVKRQLLSNGIELVTLDSGNYADVTRITLSWNGGRFDSSMPPAAVIATSLVTAGSHSMNPDAMADLLDTAGAWLSTELLSHNNTITLFALNRTLDPLLGELVDMLNRPLFPETEFMVLREKYAAKQATMLERVTTHADALDRRLSFGPDHPAARQYSPADIRDITLDETIAESRLLKGRQTPIAFLVGRITNEILQTVQLHLTRLDCDIKDQRTTTVIPARPSASARLHHEMSHSLQSAVRITIPTINRSHPDYEALRLMSTALGGYFGSRLMTNIREKKGLTYGISSAVYGYREGAFLTVSSQCDNKYTEQVIEEVEHEIEKLATVPMGMDELAAVKQTATGSMLTTLDTPFNIMDYHITLHHMNTSPGYFERQQQAIAHLTPESIRDTANRYLSDSTRLISTAGSMNPICEI